MSKQLIYSGKAKDIYTTEDENLIISTYKDQATAFNGVKKEQIAGKGVLNNQISSFIFEKFKCGWCGDSLCGETFRHGTTQ
ncbi:phosphoribosylaminoimidazole-succinocarboxamide synthetase [Streptococcus pneumoniae]|nr:phosphoribosylaminoimidazole-succinocarboxamide synthetase [Streptococcus pneumoniae]